MSQLHKVQIFFGKDMLFEPTGPVTSVSYIVDDTEHSSLLAGEDDILDTVIIKDIDGRFGIFPPGVISGILTNPYDTDVETAQQD